MASDYEKIRADNIKEYGEGIRHLSFLGRLYSDRTHFIFELLQNAEDAGATKVFFKLYKGELIVQHNASRLFNDEDVRGVCGVGEGTKEETLNKIGTFGIGFKSVYAYTNTPEIHSGDEHFKIENYVRPFKTEPIIPEKPWTTLFKFKFDNNDVDQSIAYKEIAERLKNLKARTLLFLRSIDEIEYDIEDDLSGLYLREKEPRGTGSQITVIGQNGIQDEYENWLVFKKQIHVPESNDSVFIEVGFKLEKNEETDLYKIKPINQSPLFVYFPTEKETNLGFLIQGPYKTTPARDNIPKDDSWNSDLIATTATFVVEVLHELRRLELLDVNLLKALPINPDDFPEDSMIYSIYEEVEKALLKQKLLPTSDGDYISGDRAKLARGVDLRQLLQKNQLQKLFTNHDEVNWLVGGITIDRTPVLRSYLLNNLDIEEIDSTAFARHVTGKFLLEQSDEWMSSFYEFFSTRKDAWKEGGSWTQPGPLRSKPIIRLNDNTHVIPFYDGKPNAYLAAANQGDSKLPIVKLNSVQSEIAYQFLTELGIPELDLVEEVIENLLPKYLNKSELIGDEEHRRDIGTIINALKTDSKEKKKRLLKELKNTPFLKPTSGNDQENGFYKLGELYKSNPELDLYFSNNKAYKKINEVYSNLEIETFEELGLISSIPIECNAPYPTNKQIDLQYDGNHRKGLHGFDADIEVIGLKEAIQKPTEELSILIWNKIATRYSHCIQGKVIISSRQNFSPEASTYREENIISDFGKLLIDYPWLPGSDGTFYRPNEIKPNELPSEFKKDEKLENLLGMESDAAYKLAEKIGITSEDIDFLKRYPEDFKEWKKSFHYEKDKPEFPSRSSNNPERRKAKLNEQLKDASGKKYQQKERSVRSSRNSVTPENTLRNLYTNNDDQLICQICKGEMPFRDRKGRYYFEAVEVLTKDYLDKEHEAQYIALCPVCAAKYKEFVKKDDKELLKLQEVILKTDSSEIPIKLDQGLSSIQFVETHLIDLKSILESKLKSLFIRNQNLN